MKKELRDSSNSTNYGNGTHTKPYNTSENVVNKCKDPREPPRFMKFRQRNNLRTFVS